MTKRALLMLLLAIFGFVATACHTVEGAGKDVQGMGEGVQEAAEGTREAID